MSHSRIVLDNSVLYAAVSSKDINHQRASSYLKNNSGMTKVLPALAYFEYQATLSRNGFNYRGVYIESVEIFDITREFAAKCAKQKLFDKFPKLKGADLIYACVAKILDIPLLTLDKDFDPYQNQITVVNP
jgi:predicted nucleic acid-binding protein